MTLQPEKIFLLDGIGALLSAFFLGVLLVRFEAVFGMPKSALYLLASLACLYALYSLSCYFRFSPRRRGNKINTNWRPYLRGIAMANLFHCCLTFGFVIYYYAKLTPLGLSYFLLEFLIIIFLVRIELATGKKVD
ncbi:MAG: hypothetical protein KDC34_10620 [Saprospiraceae bacterium]|nr:hypothetical protein [Saprospiraceae bacterium]